MNGFDRIEREQGARYSGAKRGGVGIGCVLAIVLSYTTNASVGWAILHGICGWFYVIYWAIFV